MPARRVNEPRRRGAQNELEQLTSLGSHLEPPAIVVDRNHGAELEAAAEVRDPRGGAHARDGTRWAEHPIDATPAA